MSPLAATTTFIVLSIVIIGLITWGNLNENKIKRWR